MGQLITLDISNTAPNATFALTYAYELPSFSFSLQYSISCIGSLGVRVLLLVRDPRGTLQSRKHRDWCPGNPDCFEPIRLCTDLVADYSAAVRLTMKYPHRFRYVFSVLWKVTLNQKCEYHTHRHLWCITQSIHPSCCLSWKFCSDVRKV
jgi:hypothetical protein